MIGRCTCGVAFSLFLKRDWDAHLRCYGLRWCGRCGEAARYGAECKPCKKRRDAEHQRAWLSVPANRAKRNEYAKAWQARNRRRYAPSYQRQKAHKRLRYSERKAA